MAETQKSTPVIYATSEKKSEEPKKIEGGKEALKSKVDVQKKSADARKETVKELKTQGENLKKIGDLIKESPDAIRKAVLRYELGQAKNAKDDFRAKEIMKKLTDAISQKKITNAEVVFKGGTDGTQHDIEKIKTNGPAWHAEKRSAFASILKLTNLEPSSARKLRDANVKIMQEYISAADPQTYISTHKAEFTKGGGLFDLALSFQRAQDARKTWDGGTLSDNSPVYLAIHASIGPNYRTSGVELRLKDAAAVEPVKPKAPEPTPVKPKVPEPTLPKPVTPEPAKTEPVKPAPAPVKPEPTKTVPVKPEPVKTVPPVAPKPTPAPVTPTTPEKPKPVNPELKETASGAVTEFNNIGKNVDRFVASGYVVLDLSASWCGPCKAMAPDIDAYAKQTAGAVKVGKLVPESEFEAATIKKYKLDGWPTLILFKNGKEVKRLEGNVKAERDIAFAAFEKEAREAGTQKPPANPEPIVPVPVKPKGPEAAKTPEKPKPVAPAESAPIVPKPAEPAKPAPAPAPLPIDMMTPKGFDQWYESEKPKPAPAQAPTNLTAPVGLDQWYERGLKTGKITLTEGNKTWDYTLESDKAIQFRESDPFGVKHNTALDGYVGDKKVVTLYVSEGSLRYQDYNAGYLIEKNGNVVTVKPRESAPPVAPEATKKAPETAKLEKWTDANGNSYEGTRHENGNIIKGTVVFPTGLRLVGDFNKDGSLSKGTMTFPDGEKREGEFKDMELVKGTNTWKDGSKLEGVFKNGLLIKGTKTWTSGTKEEGEFKDMELVKGVRTWKDGAKYEGEFEDGFFTKGTITFPSGTKEEGERKDGKLVKGVAIWNDGSIAYFNNKEVTDNPKDIVEIERAPYRAISAGRVRDVLFVQDGGYTKDSLFKQREDFKKGLDKAIVDMKGDARKIAALKQLSIVINDSKWTGKEGLRSDKVSIGIDVGDGVDDIAKDIVGAVNEYMQNPHCEIIGNKLTVSINNFDQHFDLADTTGEKLRVDTVYDKASNAPHLFWLNAAGNRVATVTFTPNGEVKPVALTKEYAVDVRNKGTITIVSQRRPKK